MKKIIIIIGVCLALALVIMGGFVWSLIDYVSRSSGDDISELAFTVVPGQAFNTIADRLHQAGIIQDTHKFKLFARLKGYDKRIKAGEYRLSSVLSPKQVLEIMVSGKVALHRVTIPEGYNLYQIAALMAEVGLIEAPEFIQAASESATVKSLGVDADTLEGYLFPDTYHFPKGLPAKKIVKTMLNRFEEVFLTEWHERAQQMKWKVHHVVTLASIIEKETGAAFERPLIASVFHNRLAKSMSLSSDPTVIYGIKNFDGNLTRKHLSTPSPYNTYLRKGLPPGPIANPGVASLEAALYPAETDYLYFVSKKDGTHQFSTNLREHNRAVWKYQLRRKRK